MSFGDLRALVQSFLNRNDAALSRNGVDLVLAAANQAQTWAQRAHTFEMLRSRVNVTVNGVTGGQLPSSVNNVERVFVEDRSVMLDYIDRSTNAARYYRIVNVRDFSTETTRIASTALLNQPYSCYLEADRLYIFPTIPPLFGVPSANIVVSLDTVNWLPTLVDDSDSNFLLEVAQDFMLWRTLYYLNGFLKEDERVKINQELMSTAWDELLSYDKKQAPDSAINELVTPVAK